MPKKKSSSRKRSNRSQQNRIAKAAIAERDTIKEPHCLILTRGSVSLELRKLSTDFQRMMEPNIPAKLQSTRKNTIKDFLAVSAQLSLTHIVSFTQTSLGTYMKLCRIPQGPTVTFKLKNFARTKDVLATLSKQFTHPAQFFYSPCIMTNIQPNEGELQLQVTARMLLDMFPNIAPSRANTNRIRRCCLFHYDEETDVFELRHYAIGTVPHEICSGVKKLMTRNIPDLGKYIDVSEYMTKSGVASDSEGEDDPKSRVTVPHKKSRGVPLKSSIRLTELGPRMSMQIYKVEGGVFGGQVLYHSFVIKTDEEKLLMEDAQKGKQKLKANRRKEQERNVEEKKKKKEQHKNKCISGMAVPKPATTKEKDDLSSSDNEGAEADDEDDDAAYYRAEVGEEPDPDFFRKRKPADEGDRPKKRGKKDFREIKKAQKDRKDRSTDRSFDEKLSDPSFRSNIKEKVRRKGAQEQRKARARAQL